VVIVGVGVKHDHGARSQARDHVADVADAHPGVEEHGLLAADDEVGNRFLELVRLVDGESGRCDFVDLEPRFIPRYAFERFVLRTRQSLAPVGFVALRRRRKA